jgi:hypothetical protein
VAGSDLVVVTLPKARPRKSRPWAARTSPCDSQSYNGLKVRFSVTVGEEPEVEVGLV